MASDEMQQESLETLKLINAAATSLRLYPMESSQVSKSFENAYQGVKSFLRKYGQLRFSCHDGVCLLAGKSVDRSTQERLQLLTFNDILQKLGLAELVLFKGFDRKVFKKILSVFNATPEQVQKVGGSRLFIEQLQLNDVFPEEYVAPGESEEELVRKQQTEQTLKELAGKRVDADDLHYLFGKKEGQALHEKVIKKFQTADGAARLVATAVFSILQILQKQESVSISPTFVKLFERIGSLIEEASPEKQEEYEMQAAALLTPSLGEYSLMILLCQEFPGMFGSFFYESIVRSVKDDRLNRICQWMKNQHEKEESSAATTQRDAIGKGYERLQNTPRVKQLIAVGTASAQLAKSEEGKKTKRVQAGIKALADGDMESLEDSDVRRSLPSTIHKLLLNGKEPLAAAIIQNVVSGVKDDKNAFRSEYCVLIGSVVEKLVLLERWDWLKKLTPVCLAWIWETESLDVSYVQYIKGMQTMMNHGWHTGENELAERILNVFYQIRSGVHKKPEEHRNVIARIQDENVDPALLQKYLDACFVRPVDERICKKITMQGPVAARFLIDTLIGTDERSDRIRLLKLLSEVGASLVPVLLDRLPDPMPWYGKRNIIRLLSETGSQKDVEAVLEYILHEDLRVQEETLQCIIRLGKGAVSEYLLRVLPDAAMGMKVQIVQRLQRVADESVVPPLAELLEDCKLYQGEERNILAEEICHSLGASGSAEAIPVLKEIVNGSVKLFGSGTVEAATNAVRTLQKLDKRGHEPEKPLPESPQVVPLQSAKTMGKMADGGRQSPVEYVCIMDSAEEREVYKLLAAGKLEIAKEKLLQLIDKSAKQKRFQDAEDLRLRLIEIDPMALSDIITAAQYIEDAKTAGVDQEHVRIWSELYDLFSTEEFNAFYHALKHEKYPKDTVLATQGERQLRLFFINQGRVKLFYREKNNEVLVKSLADGHIFGGDAFFNDSVSTLDATSLGAVDISTLSLEKVDDWKDTFPGLESKIRDYCTRGGTETEFFLSSKADRRRCKRERYSDTVYLDLLNHKGDVTDTTIRGTGSDISRGGLSFLSRISRRKQARQLLGRKVGVRLERNGVSLTDLKLRGRVVAVRNLHSVDLGRSVHVCFDEGISQLALTQLLGRSKH